MGLKVGLPVPPPPYAAGVCAGCEQGPQVDQDQLDKILEYMAVGQREGARLVCGGKRIGDKGYFVEVLLLPACCWLHWCCLPPLLLALLLLLPPLDMTSLLNTMCANSFCNSTTLHYLH